MGKYDRSRRSQPQTREQRLKTIRWLAEEVLKQSIRLQLTANKQLVVNVNAHAHFSRYILAVDTLVRLAEDIAETDSEIAATVQPALDQLRRVPSNFAVTYD